MPAEANCLCGSNNLFSECCEPYLQNKKEADNPETLMRSRYCAFALRDYNYIRKTWHPERGSLSTRVAERQFGDSDSVGVGFCHETCRSERLLLGGGVCGNSFFCAIWPTKSVELETFRGSELNQISAR